MRAEADHKAQQVKLDAEAMIIGDKTVAA